MYTMYSFINSQCCNKIGFQIKMFSNLWGLFFLSRSGFKGLGKYNRLTKGSENISFTSNESFKFRIKLLSMIKG